MRAIVLPRRPTFLVSRYRSMKECGNCRARYRSCRCSAIDDPPDSKIISGFPFGARRTLITGPIVRLSTVRVAFFEPRAREPIVKHR